MEKQSDTTTLTTRQQYDICDEIENRMYKLLSSCAISISSATKRIFLRTMAQILMKTAQ